MIAECQCQNGLDGNLCDVTTGQCGLCKPGFFGDFCDKGKQKCLWKFTSKYSKEKIIIADCQCQNSLDGNACDVTTGQCGICKPGFFGDFCDKGK